MPDPSLPPEALHAASCALAALSQDEVGYAWSAGLTEQITRTVWAALLPHLGLPQRRPRTICPTCENEVVRRDDGSPISHPTRNRAAVCEHGHCRGGCRGCRP